MTEYVRVGKKQLRIGFTTGTCAAGAAKAAALMALYRENLTEVDIILPDGKSVTLPLCRSDLTEEGAIAAIEKDGGDDPDITTGLHIEASVILNRSKEISLRGGEGVGRVTLNGLKVPVGEPAINPVPRGMIQTNVKSVLPKGYGADVTISVPGGKEVAKKTFNPKLGIEGGISILGSTGIVHPMSEEALKESLALELSVLLSKGYKEVIYAFGNYGLSFLRENGISDGRVVKVSNFIGFMLDEAVNRGVERLLLTGHIGKMIKVSGGIFYTHNRIADCRMEILAAYAALAGASRDIVEEIYGSTTTTAAASIIERAGLETIYDRIVKNVIKRAESYVFGEVEISAILFGDDNKLLYMDQKAKEWIGEFAYV